MRRENFPNQQSFRGFLFSQFLPFCSSRPSVALELNPVAPPMEAAERRPVRPRRFGRRRSLFLVFLATDGACFCVRFCVKMEHFFPYFEKSTKKKQGAPAPNVGCRRPKTAQTQLFGKPRRRRDAREYQNIPLGALHDVLRALFRVFVRKWNEEIFVTV